VSVIVIVTMGGASAHDRADTDLVPHLGVPSVCLRLGGVKAIDDGLALGIERSASRHPGVIG